jgi:hypothetical protein
LLLTISQVAATTGEATNADIVAGHAVADKEKAVKKQIGVEHELVHCKELG